VQSNALGIEHRVLRVHEADARAERERDADRVHPLVEEVRRIQVDGESRARRRPQALERTGVVDEHPGVQLQADERPRLARGALDWTPDLARVVPLALEQAVPEDGPDDPVRRLAARARTARRGDDASHAEDPGELDRILEALPEA